jgi:hypothetical protein
MATAANAKLMYESSRTAVAMAALTDSGDHMTLTSTGGPWSKKSGATPIVRPNGILNGGAVIPSLVVADNKVDVAAILCNLNGVETTVPASVSTAAITRPASAKAKINSITITTAGAIEVIAGTDADDTTFVETRAAKGGPPLIPVASIEIAQVRVVSDTDAPITAAQIFQAPGTHAEYANLPLYSVDYENGKVVMESALPLIHTGPVARKTFASYSIAAFSAVPKVKDFKPAEESASVSSESYYGGVIASSSTSLGQASFKAFLDDGITDPLLALKGEDLWFRFYPDRLKAPYHAFQGLFTVSRTFPVDAQISADCQVSVEVEGSNKAS